MSFRIAHLSDCHLGPMPKPSVGDLLSQRILGYANWQKNRAKSFTPGTTDRLIADMQAQTPDHIAVTGDLVNIALEAEFERAGKFLESLGSADQVTAIPGNHDAYVRGALARFNHHCAPYLTSDTPHGSTYPVIRKRGPVTIIALSSAIATAPFMASGKVDEAQQKMMMDALSEAGDQFQVVLIHHPPFEGATKWHKRLVNADALRARWAKQAPHLILHGHTHLPTRKTVLGPDGPVPVFGVSSAAQGVGGHKPPANYTLFEIEPQENGWSVTATRRGYSPGNSQDIVQISQERFEAKRR